MVNHIKGGTEVQKDKKRIWVSSIKHLRNCAKLASSPSLPTAPPPPPNRVQWDSAEVKIDLNNNFFLCSLFSLSCHQNQKFKPLGTESVESGKWKRINNTKSLARNQVCAIFHMRDIWKNFLHKFIV